MSVAGGIAWPKDFQELKVIDGLLRCGICYEYLRTSLVTPCSHNYCSFCIRKSMQYKTQCPTCFKETFEVNLQNNRTLDEIVENFTGIRDKLIRHLRIAEVHLSVQQASHLNVLPDTNVTPVKTKTEIGKTNAGKGNPLKLKTPHSEKKKGSDLKLRSTPKTDLKKSKLDSIVITTDDDDNDNDNSDREAENCLIANKENNNLRSPQKSIVKEKANGVVIPEIFLQPVSPKKKTVTKSKEQEDVVTVPCPVCSVEIPERNINIHLDSCLYRSERPVRKQSKRERKRSPLPKMVYNMMPEKELRKKLKDHGLDQKGDKKMLISRLQRFTVLYNSECDAIEPRPVSALIQQIENEEKDEKKSHPHRPAINRHTDPKIIEEENNKYLRENKNSFAALIKSLREREAKKPKEMTIIDDDDDDDDNNDNEACSSKNDIHDDRKENTTAAEKNIKHNEEKNKHDIFSSEPSTSGSTSIEKENKQAIEIVDESSDDESSCFAPVIPRFTPPKRIKVKNMLSMSTDGDGSRDNDDRNKCIVRNSPAKTENKIIVNTQKLSDEELGIHNEISSDVNSVYQASDNEEGEAADSSDNESVSLLAAINEGNPNSELPNGNLPNVDDGDDSNHKDDCENEINPNSQIEDPDFVVNTQDLEEENTEEFFQPRRKTPVRNSKRKGIRTIHSDSDDSDNDHLNRNKEAEIDKTPQRSLRKRVKH